MIIYLHSGYHILNIDIHVYLGIYIFAMNTRMFIYIDIYIYIYIYWVCASRLAAHVTTGIGNG